MKRATKPIALLAAASSAVTGVGAPSYTSGAQAWNGTTAILKPNPAIINKLDMNINSLKSPSMTPLSIPVKKALTPSNVTEPVKA